MSVATVMKALADAVRAKTGKTGALTLEQMTSELNAIPNNDSSDLTASGPTVTVPAGNYKEQATKSVDNNGAISGTITGLDDTAGVSQVSHTIPAGYTSGGAVTLTDDIETLLSSL